MSKVPEGFSVTVIEAGAMYDVKRMSALLGVGVRTVRRWCRDGVLPAFKVGRSWFCYGRSLLELDKPDVRIRQLVLDARRGK